MARFVPSRNTVVLGTAVVLLLAALAVTGTMLSVGRSSSARGAGSSGASGATAGPPPDPPLQLVSTPADGATGFPLDASLSVTAANAGGQLRSVTVTTASGQAVPGGLDPTGNWASAPGNVLAPGTTYQIAADGMAPNGHLLRGHSSFTTLTPLGTLKPSINVGDGQTVGVGMPIVVRFTHSVTNRAAVQSHLTVTPSIPVTGAWHWFGPREVHYRPQAYWPSGEQVTMAAQLLGVNAGGNIWGLSNHSVHFSVGDTHVSTVDTAAHTMTVTDNGHTVRTVPVSTGRTNLPTMNGIHIALAKTQNVLMDSQTVGIPRSSPDGYYEHVYWDVAITTGGEYVHAAPWSVGEQGRSNVSHGCVNLSPSEATWFYGFSQVGDIVQVTGSTRAPTGDPGTADWNMSWSQWLAGTAA